MKIHHLGIFFLVGVFGIINAWAGFKIPSHVYRSHQLPEAAEQAKKDNKALAFVYTEETST